MNEKLILACLIPVLVALTIAVAVLAVMVILYRRRVTCQENHIGRLRKSLRSSNRRLRRAKSAYSLADAAAQEELDAAKKELRIARELLEQANKAARKRNKGSVPAEVPA